MKSMWNDADRQSMLARIERVGDATPARWGKMNAGAMIDHLTNSLRMATGELPTKSKMLPIRFFPLKQLIIYALPFPKGAPTATELVGNANLIASERKPELLRRLGALSSSTDTTSWPSHPAFGSLSRQAWGVLMYRHFDHHLRQFGV